MDIVRPIVEDVRRNGDAAVLKGAYKFEGATSLTTPVLHAPFPSELMNLPSGIQEAIDVSISNIARFYRAQKGDNDALRIETMPGVVCFCFS